MIRKINKSRARAVFNKGAEVILIPCKVSVCAIHHNGNQYVKPLAISKTKSKHAHNIFDKEVNDYETANCNSNLGYRASYYINTSDEILYK